MAGDPAADPVDENGARRQSEDESHDVEPFRLVADKQLRFGSRAPHSRPVLELWPHPFDESEQQKRRDLQRDRTLAAWHRTFAERRTSHQPRRH